MPDGTQGPGDWDHTCASWLGQLCMFVVWNPATYLYNFIYLVLYLSTYLSILSCPVLSYPTYPTLSCPTLSLSYLLSMICYFCFSLNVHVFAQYPQFVLSCLLAKCAVWGQCFSQINSSTSPYQIEHLPNQWFNTSTSLFWLFTFQSFFKHSDWVNPGGIVQYLILAIKLNMTRMDYIPA